MSNLVPWNKLEDMILLDDFKKKSKGQTAKT